jgi:hypothetical protein
VLRRRPRKAAKASNPPPSSASEAGSGTLTGVLPFPFPFPFPFPLFPGAAMTGAARITRVAAPMPIRRASDFMGLSNLLYGSNNRRRF